MDVANSCEGARREKIVQACQNVSYQLYKLTSNTLALSE